ncbi:hypothetical protein Moror_12829 [Moniliophthora roreri MCA 2997]|uniref:Uncharacterized protein n=1 Tax=Moniliophthora roreri (strain MCA 2997) TaxID=1381753 RepID=V2YQY6_MONRO|nr:hypothetical protein Moror_12829 [Moniliophthora roreri MCA 2997]
MMHRSAIRSASPVGTHATSHYGYSTEAEAGVEGEKRELKDYDEGIARLRVRVMTESTENRPSPISEVPDEIWDHIFTELCSSHDYTLSYTVGKEKHVESPALVLSQVCSQWRNVARSRPQLWSSISVDIFQSSHDIRFLLEVYFTNSKDRPLKLRIADFLPGLDDLSGPAVTCEEYFGRNGFMAFQLLLQQASRWQELFLNDVHWRLLALPDHPEVSFSTLQHFTCLADMDAVVDDTRWFWNSIAKAPNLVDADLNSLMDLDVIPYSQVTSLSIDAVDDLGDLCQTLQMCTMLEQLLIDDCDLAVIENELPPEVVLPNLQRLCLNAASVSKLEPIFTLLTTPSLNDLEVDCRSGSDRTPDVGVMEWSLSPLERLLKRSECSLETLTIMLPASLYLTRQSLEGLLKETPNLQSMFISFHPLQGSALNTSTLFSMLELSPPEHSWDPPQLESLGLVPRLDALFIHEQGAVIDSKITDIALDMLESRSKIRFIDKSGLVSSKVAIVDFRDKVIDRRNVCEYLELKPVPFGKAVLNRLYALQRYGPTAFAAYS